MATPLRPKPPFHWLAVLVLLGVACRYTPSSAAATTSDTPSRSQKPMVQFARPVVDSKGDNQATTPPDPGPPTFRDFIVDLNNDGDLDNDGQFELISNFTFQFDGLPHPDIVGGLVGRYNPYYVYTIDDSCFLNKPLMKQYNQQHYVFAGYEYSDDIKVFYPEGRSKKPHLWKQ